MAASYQSSFAQKIEQQTKQIIGNCPEHDRVYECYSLQANIAICASCLMFGQFKGHDVISLEESSAKLRKELDQSLRQNILKTENTQSVLLDIRHNILTCEEQKTKILNETSQKFKDLIKTLKQRKAEVEIQINELFDTQYEQLKLDEIKWEEKESACKDLLLYAKSHDNNVIISNSKKIVDTLCSLREEKNFKKVHIINDVDSDFKAQNSKDKILINHQELIKCLESHMKLGDQVSLQYRV